MSSSITFRNIIFPEATFLISQILPADQMAQIARAPVRLLVHSWLLAWTKVSLHLVVFIHFYTLKRHTLSPAPVTGDTSGELKFASLTKARNRKKYYVSNPLVAKKKLFSNASCIEIFI